MSDSDPFEIFLSVNPGLEAALAQEAKDAGFAGITTETGGVSISGGWPEVWRANLTLRGAGRVLVRLAQFRAVHLAQLDKRARAVDWSSVLRPDVPVRVEASCRKSKIYHSGAAAQRVETAIAETLGATLSPDADLRVVVRIENNLCTISIDSSGEGLHRRGHKQAVNRAPMRETLAALFLRQCGYRGTEPVLDPMCGSGTFVIEAGEIALGLAPGRSRDFAFMSLNTFDADGFAALKSDLEPSATECRFFGSDRDAGAIKMSLDNAARAGVNSITQFSQLSVDQLERPDGPTGLVIVNPPYGLRIGDRKKLYPLYQTFGQVMRSRFGGWRVGLVTADPALARACGLDFTAGPGVDNNGTRVALYQTQIRD